MTKSKSAKRGGSGAAEHAIKVFGGMNEQHAQEGSNVIAVKVGGAGAAEHAIAVFGNINEQHAQPGSNVIATKVGGKNQGGKQQQLEELQEKLNQALLQQQQVPTLEQSGGEQQQQPLEKLQQLQQLLQQRGGKLNKQNSVNNWNNKEVKVFYPPLPSLLFYYMPIIVMVKDHLTNLPAKANVLPKTYVVLLVNNSSINLYAKK
jgi:hypothetical protein